MDTLRQTFGKALRAQRKKAGLSRAALAKQVELTENMIGRIERGQNSTGVDRIELMAKALNVPVTVLFGAPGHSENRVLQLIVDDLQELDTRQLKLVHQLIQAAQALGRRS
jgi:transcriptional regulator with XRE-family HTH domain